MGAQSIGLHQICNFCSFIIEKKIHNKDFKNLLAVYEKEGLDSRIFDFKIDFCVFISTEKVTWNCSFYPDKN